MQNSYSDNYIKTSVNVNPCFSQRMDYPSINIFCLLIGELAH